MSPTRYADVLPCHDDDMAGPPQTPDYQRGLDEKANRRILIFSAFLVGGIIAIAVGVVVRTVLPGAVWLGVVALGVVLTVLSVLIPVRWAIIAAARVEKDRALREPGTVQLLTATTSPVDWGDTQAWKLTSDIQIRLDSGHTFNGTYHTIEVVALGHRAKDKPSDKWFHVGASLRCLYNPTNPDKVLVFPFAARGDELTYNEIAVSGREHVRFWSAT